MTKKKYLYLSSALILLSFIIWKFLPHSPSDLNKQSAVNKNQNGQVEAKDQTTKMKLNVSANGEKYENTPSHDWKAKVEKHLRNLGGNDLKEIHIQKERSVIISRDNHNLMVESVVIKLTNNQNSRSSFRAMVDPQTGKILETWDRTVFDPGNVREGFRFKLDPRYTN